MSDDNIKQPEIFSIDFYNQRLKFFLKYRFLWPNKEESEKLYACFCDGFSPEAAVNYVFGEMH